MSLKADIRIAVTSRSFSKNQILRNELLSKYKNVTFNDQGLKLNGDSLVAFLKGHNKAIIALETINESILSQLPELKVVSKYGVGLDMIDITSLSKYGVRLGWKGGVNKRSVAELVLSFAIMLLHRIPCAMEQVKRGDWFQVIGRQLSGSTIGVIGCGHIGQDVIKLLAPYKCKILSYDILDFPSFYKKYNVEPVKLEDLLQRSDVITLHLPFNESTENILDFDMLSLIKKEAVLINLARGGLIDEVELKSRLVKRTLFGAALDVFSVEPPIDTEFAHLENVLVTPHIGGSTEEAILAMGRCAIEGLEEFNA
jgi:phosphoglycerate dehydrogenase-like enzyme